MLTAADRSDRIAAGKLGISVDELRTRRANGLKHCGACDQWKPRTEMLADGRASNARCRACHNAAKRPPSANEREQVGRGAPRCEVVGCPRVGKFLLSDGSRACAGHLKERVKERRATP